SDEFEAEFTADQGRGALKALDRDVSLGFQNAINLGAACVHALSKRRLSNALPFHFLAQLPSQHARQRFGLRGFTNAFLAEEGVQSRAPMGVLFRAHSSISFIRRRARSRSSAGVFCVFLMNPCTTPMRSSCTKNNSRAIRRLGSVLRTSQSPCPSGRQSGIPIGQPNCTVARSVPIARRSTGGRLRSHSTTGSVPP